MASPPVSRFTAIRFLPPLRAFVLSYCLCRCFLREQMYFAPSIASLHPAPPLDLNHLFIRFSLSLSRCVPFLFLLFPSLYISALPLSLFLFNRSPFPAAFNLPPLVFDTNEYICSGKKRRGTGVTQSRALRNTPESVIISGQETCALFPPPASGLLPRAAPRFRFLVFLERRV